MGTERRHAYVRQREAAPALLHLQMLEHQCPSHNLCADLTDTTMRQCEVIRILAVDHFSMVMLTIRTSRYAFPSVPRSNTNVVGTSVSESSSASTQYEKKNSTSGRNPPSR